MVKDITPMNRRSFIGTAGIVSGTLMAGCLEGDDGSGDGEGTGDGSDDEETVFRFGVMTEAANLDPAYYSNATDQHVNQAVFDTIAYIDDDFNYVPNMIEEFPDPQDGGDMYELTLREGMTFHNGDPVTAEDLQYSIEFRANPDNNARYNIPNVDSTEVVDDRVLRLHLSEPNTLLNQTLRRQQRTIVQKDGRGGLDTEGDLPASNLSSEPTGAAAGPFKFVEWESGSHILLERNEDYWNEDYPNVDYLQFDIISEDATRISQLQAGEVHALEEVPPKDYDIVIDDDEIETQLKTGQITQEVHTNIRPFEGNPIADVHNRRAVQFAIDEEEVAEQVFNGNATPMTGSWYPDNEWTSPRLAELTRYDPDQAQKELELAGNPDGFEVDMITVNYSWYPDQAELIQEQLSRVGIESDIQTSGATTYTETLYNTNDWHLAPQDHAFDDPSPWTFLYTKWGNNARNHSGWHSPTDTIEQDDQLMPSGPPVPEDYQDEYDNSRNWFYAMLDEAAASPEEERQKEIIHMLQEYVAENGIQMFVAIVDFLENYRPEVDEFTGNAYEFDFRGAETSETY